MVEHVTVVHGITGDKTHRGGWTEHEPTGRAVVRCTCGLDSGIVAESQAVQIADDHRENSHPWTDTPDSGPLNFDGTNLLIISLRRQRSTFAVTAQGAA
ncbi:hypothetical protein ACFV2U_46355 [Streptomyces sp. NPDC059697]|uniref:hypothetical protein n=1 Tax=Streptomyces sp. NPDC059697 TaxID=3346912 RepID=UPI003694FCCC